MLAMENIIDKTVLVATITQPQLSYEYDEFIIRRDPETEVWYAGSDGGCSCYDGFNPANFEPFQTVPQLRTRFGHWIDRWYDGVGQEAAAWEAFNKAVRS